MTRVSRGFSRPTLETTDDYPFSCEKGYPLLYVNKESRASYAVNGQLLTHDSNAPQSNSWTSASTILIHTDCGIRRRSMR